LPIELWQWGPTAGLLHVALLTLSGALLIEVFFWTFDKVPFTCSYFPGKMNLALLVVFYLYGFTAYSFRMADIEVWMERGAIEALLVSAATAAALVLFWRHKTTEEPIRFDGSEPEIQILDLN